MFLRRCRCTPKTNPNKKKIHFKMSEELIEYAEHLIEEEENKTRGCNVEKILNKRIQNGITEYYVKWVRLIFS